MAGDTFNFNNSNTTWTIDYSDSTTTDSTWYWNPDSGTTTTDSITITTPVSYDFVWVDEEKENLKSENDLLKRTIKSLLELYCGEDKEE